MICRSIGLEGGCQLLDTSGPQLNGRTNIYIFPKYLQERILLCLFHYYSSLCSFLSSVFSSFTHAFLFIQSVLPLYLISKPIQMLHSLGNFPRILHSPDNTTLSFLCLPSFFIHVTCVTDERESSPALNF